MRADIKIFGKEEDVFASNPMALWAIGSGIYSSNIKEY